MTPPSPRTRPARRWPTAVARYEAAVGGEEAEEEEVAVAVDLVVVDVVDLEVQV